MSLHGHSFAGEPLIAASLLFAPAANNPANKKEVIDLVSGSEGSSSTGAQEVRHGTASLTSTLSNKAGRLGIGQLIRIPTRHWVPDSDVQAGMQVDEDQSQQGSGSAQAEGSPQAGPSRPRSMYSEGKRRDVRAPPFLLSI